MTSVPANARLSADLSQVLARLFSRNHSIVLLVHEFALLAARDAALAERYRVRHAARRDFLAAVLTERHEQTGVPMSLPASQLAEAFLALADGLEGGRRYDETWRRSC